jgi:pyruvate formate lyase activating enzyme
MSVQEVMHEILCDRIFYEQSGGGVTFSGGEPLQQPLFLDELLTECNHEGISTAMDTCGYAEKATLLDLASKTDLVLYDLKGCDDARHRSNTGVDATPILENLDALARVHHSIWLRVPIVPNYTDMQDEMESLAARYASLNSIKRVTLLPCHPLGDGKLKKMGYPPKMKKIPAKTSPDMGMIAEIWKHHGFETHIGA